MLIPVIIMLIFSTKTRDIYKGLLTGLTLGTITGLVFHLFNFSAVFANHNTKNEATGFLISGINDILPTIALVISVFGIMGVLTFGPVLNKVGHAKNIHPYRRANLLDGTANRLPAIFLS